MSKPSPVYQSASDLCAQIRAGTLRSVDVVQAHLDQIARYNPQVHAVVTLRAQAALAEARAADAAVAAGQTFLGPLHGLPLLLKDASRVKGVRSTFGALPQYALHMPSSDATLVHRLRQAGAIVLGRTNLPLLSLDWQCRNPLFAETVNPWDASRTPGGSSGGAAAALATGMTPLELGSDLGGSIRYPAHCCGVMGLRPTDGLLPLDDIGPEDHAPVFRHVLSVGPMARHLDDLQLMFEVLSATPAPPPPPPRPLRIACALSLGAGTAPDASTSLLFSQLIQRLRRDGHSVTENAAPALDWNHAYRIWGLITGYELGTALPGPLRSGLGRRVFEGYLFHYKLGPGPLTHYMLQGLECGEAVYYRALGERSALMKQAADFLADYDLWLLPVSPGEAIARQRRGKAIAWQGEKVAYSQFIGGLLAPTALLGTPALSLPLGLGAQGLPVGMQVHAAHGQDFELLAHAQQALSPYLVQGVPPGFEDPIKGGAENGPSSLRARV